MSPGRGDKIAAIEKLELRGFLHRPTEPNGAGLVLTHGAGGDCTAPLLVAVATHFCAAGIAVLRCDLAFRRRRAKGPPSPATAAAADRAGLEEAVAELRKHVAGPLYLGGHSYGGRQASMLAAEKPAIAAALLLLSYPLHPPAKPAQLRTQHFPKLHVPALFVTGTTDGFASLAELEAAIAAIPVPTRIIAVEGAGHDLKRGKFDFGAIAAALPRLAG
ncbi:MAG TPA: alpha/beta family hydrolase [Stellaceae bacterium]|nr:alpha/beta family hydrolase [Stellaceae bacterium]